jgi:hypothetical protein
VVNPIQQALEHATKLENMLIESGGEITPEIQIELSFNSATIEELVDIKYMSLERIDKAIEYYKEKSEQFSRIAHSLKSANSFVSDSIKKYMIDNAKNELQGSDYRFTVRRTKPKLNILDEDAIFGAYKKETTEIVLDKEKITDDLKNGIPVEGCELIEVYSLRKYVNKGKK